MLEPSRVAGLRTSLKHQICFRYYTGPNFDSDAQAAPSAELVRFLDKAIRMAKRKARPASEATTLTSQAGLSGSRSLPVPCSNDVLE